MSDNQSNNKRIAKNSIFLYMRTLIVMAVTLYTSRVILQSLGVEDYGVYNVVGGVVSMFNIILGSMTDATQRFLTLELGKGEGGQINKVFSTSLILHVTIAVLLVLIAEPLGLWFLYNKLIIPVERISAAFWVFQCSLASLFILVISVPYNALIIAHERMKAFAYISIIDAGLRLLIAYLVAINFGIDKLILYAILMALSQILLRYIYNLYCKKHFSESKFIFTKDRNLIKEFGNFAMWSLFGNISFVCSNYGISLLLGTFFEPFVNAAQGIAMQVQGAFSTFVKNFQTAINPQITKNYASGNLDEMSNLVFRGARISFLLILIPVIPVLFEAGTVLYLWLKNVPEYAVQFVQLMILMTLISTIRNPLEVASKATGNIRLFEVYVYGTKLLILPCAYICLRCGASPVSVFIVSLFFEVIAIIMSLFETHRLTGLSIVKYVQNVIVRIVITVIASITTPLIITHYMVPGLKRLLVLSICSILSTFIWSCLLGLTKNERNYIIKFVKSKIR